MRPQLSDRVRWKLGAHGGEGIILGKHPDGFWLVSLDKYWDENLIELEPTAAMKESGYIAVLEPEVREILERPLPPTLEEALEWVRE